MVNQVKIVNPKEVQNRRVQVVDVQPILRGPQSQLIRGTNCLASPHTATEAFFEKPRQLKKKRPELYEELRSYYKQDPANWAKSNSA